VRSEVFKVVLVKTDLIWDVMLCVINKSPTFNFSDDELRKKVKVVL